MSRQLEKLATLNHETATAVSASNERAVIAAALQKRMEQVPKGYSAKSAGRFREHGVLRTVLVDSLQVIFTGRSSGVQGEILGVENKVKQFNAKLASMNIELTKEGFTAEGKAVTKMSDEDRIKAVNTFATSLKKLDERERTKITSMLLDLALVMKSGKNDKEAQFLASLAGEALLQARGTKLKKSDGEEVSADLYVLRRALTRNQAVREREARQQKALNIMRSFLWVSALPGLGVFGASVYGLTLSSEVLLGAFSATALGGLGQGLSSARDIIGEGRRPQQKAETPGPEPEPKPKPIDTNDPAQLATLKADLQSAIEAEVGSLTGEPREAKIREIMSHPDIAALQATIAEAEKKLRNQADPVLTRLAQEYKALRTSVATSLNEKREIEAKLSPLKAKTDQTDADKQQIVDLESKLNKANTDIRTMQQKLSETDDAFRKAVPPLSIGNEELDGRLAKLSPEVRKELEVQVASGRYIEGKNYTDEDYRSLIESFEENDKAHRIYASLSTEMKRIVEPKLRGTRTLEEQIEILQQLSWPPEIQALAEGEFAKASPEQHDRLIQVFGFLATHPLPEDQRKQAMSELINAKDDDYQRIVGAYAHRSMRETKEKGKKADEELLNRKVHQAIPSLLVHNPT